MKTKEMAKGKKGKTRRTEEFSRGERGDAEF